MTEKGRNEALAEAEYCLATYFAQQIAPLMHTVRQELTAKQRAEATAYGRSAAGVLAGLATEMHGAGGGTATDTLRTTGQWSSATAEDYARMCEERMAGTKDLI